MKIRKIRDPILDNFRVDGE